MSRFSPLISGGRRVVTEISKRLDASWRWYRARKRWQQIAIAAIVAVVIVGLLVVLRGGVAPESKNQVRTVTLQSVAALSGSGDSVSVVGSVRSISEAAILAQSGGTVRMVHTQIGREVPAGFVIAELDNAGERAVVLQAQGAYEAALAARSITLIQASNTGESLEEAEVSARNTYRSAFTAIDSALENYVDPLLSGVDRVQGVDERIRTERDALRDALARWRRDLDTLNTQSPDAVLERAETTARRVATFLSELSTVVNSSDSGATVAQKTGVATARASVDSTLASISAERSALKSAQTAASVATRQTSSTGAQTASADASVKQALGALRGAQASLEKTLVRAPIGGTVNFLPIRVGDYVTNLMHVATVAKNGALEIVTYVSEEDRSLLAVGDKVTVEDTYSGIITSISPALDPTTKQIEILIAMQSGSGLINGQSVRIAFPNAVKTTKGVSGPLMLPLASVKLRANDRIVFTVGAEGTLVANAVEVGVVRGGRIEILTPLAPEVQIVTDARGLSEGQQVNSAAAL